MAYQYILPPPLPMTIKNTNRPLFKPDKESILVRGLNAMTKACEALTTQNDKLNKDIEGLKSKIARLQERVLTDSDDKE